MKDIKSKGSKEVCRNEKGRGQNNLIATRDDAKDEANRQHVVRIATIGNKEGIIEGVHNRVGGAITDIVLKTADATNDKNVDNIEIHKLIKYFLDAAERPEAVAARENTSASLPPPSTSG